MDNNRLLADFVVWLSSLSSPPRPSPRSTPISDRPSTGDCPGGSVGEESDEKRPWYLTLNKHVHRLATIYRVRRGIPQSDDKGGQQYIVYEYISIQPSSERSAEVRISGPAYHALCDALCWHNRDPVRKENR